MNSNTPLNPTAVDYTPKQLSTPPSPYLEARLLNLEQEHLDLRQDVDSLNELYHQLSSTFNTSKKAKKPFDSIEEQDPTKSRQSALQLQRELESLSKEAHDIMMSKVNGGLPPNLRTASGASNGAAAKSLPPHLRGKDSNG